MVHKMATFGVCVVGSNPFAKVFSYGLDNVKIFFLKG